jgi:hypothetical protein
MTVEKNEAAENESRGDEYVPTQEDLDTAEAAEAAAAEALAAEEKAAAEKLETDKKVTIPKDRFDAAVTKERERAEAAETTAKELQAQLDANKVAIDTVKLETEIEELEDQLDAAMADNQVEEKKRLRKEIRTRQEAISEARAEQRSRYATAVAVEQIRYDALLDRLEAAHPEINADSDEYDETIAADVLDLKSAYEAKGLGSAEALRKAAGFVFKEVAKVEKPKEEEKPKLDADAAAKRKEEAIAKGLAARKGQPPKSSAAGLDSAAAGGAVTKATIGKLNDADFDKLTPEELAVLRGDSI